MNGCLGKRASETETVFEVPGVPVVDVIMFNWIGSEHIGQSLRFRFTWQLNLSLFTKQVSMLISILAVINTFTREIYTWMS